MAVGHQDDWVVDGDGGLPGGDNEGCASTSIEMEVGSIRVLGSYCHKLLEESW